MGDSTMSGINNTVLVVVGVMVLVGSLIASLYGKNTLWAGVVAAAICFSFAHLDSISWIKAGPSGFEAKTRELIIRAESTVNEANVTIKELRELATVLAEATLTNTQMGGRLGGMPRTEKEQIGNAISALLDRLNVSQEEKEKAWSSWYKCVEFDYVGYVLEGVMNSNHVSGEINALWERRKRGGIESRLSPDEVTKLLEATNELNSDRAERLEDYKYYVANRQHRRPQVWNQRR